MLGAVRIWGKALVGRVSDPTGELAAPALRYRSQYAEVLALAREDDGAQEIAQRMGVPAVAETYLEPYARELGQQLRGQERMQSRSTWPP